MFVDRIKVFAHAGDGGRGSVSFRREKFVPRGGPDGGDGGRGGDVILRADVHTDNLANLFYEPIIKAKSGTHGMGKKMHGKGAPAKIVNVPIGTVVFRAETPPERTSEIDKLGHASSDIDVEGPAQPTAEESAALDQVVDLSKEGQQFVLCAGGRGGKG